jgi:iron(III) transport system permease protein
VRRTQDKPDLGLRLRLRSERARPLPLTAEAILLAFLVAFLIVPILLAIGRGFYVDGQLSLWWFRRVLSNDVLMGQLANSLLLASTTTLVCLLIAVPLAVLRARCRFAGQGILGVLVLVPLILPPFVGALSMKRLLGQFGVLNLALERVGIIELTQAPDWLGSGFPAVVILQSLHLFPILYLNASAALANIDPAYQQAARNLGASPWKTFARITLPLMRPGLFAGGTIVFIWSFTDIGTPAIIGYDHVVPVTIFRGLASADISPRVYSLVFIMLSGSVTLYVLGKFFFGRALSGETSKTSTAAELRRLGPLGTLGAWCLFGTIIVFALLPHAGVVLLGLSDHWVNSILPAEYTLRHLRHVITDEQTTRSILNSLRYAGVSTLVDVVFGSVAAWLIIRSRVLGATLLDGMAMLPLAVPGLILAAGYVAMTAPGSPLEQIGPRHNPFVILVIAYSVRRLPFVVRGVSAGLQQVPVSLEEAARNLGASKLRAALKITVPLITANIVAAGVLTFAFAVLEVSDSLILAQSSVSYPITKQIYRLASSTGSVDATNQAAALGIYGMALLGGTMGLASALLGKRLGAIFRA